MVEMCHPETDWSCVFTEQELEELREDEVQAALLGRSEDLAWSLLGSLTLYRVGICPVVVRPCAARCNPGGDYAAAVVGSLVGSGFRPYLSGGKWYNACGCRSRDDCSCSELSEVILPGPVGGVSSVRIDGVALDPSAYRVDNGNRLVRTDGEPWPACQNLNADSTEDDSTGVFEVEYYRGAPPNRSIQAAAGALAQEFYKACSGDNCRLPGNVTSVVRQGVSYELQPMDFPEGFTGIPEVDAIIRIYNPNKLKSGFSVASPDSRRTRVTTWGR